MGTRGGIREGRVRIIGGAYRRTPISVVPVPGLRPTPDRVRETVFNWLEHLLGDFAALDALDLFAGSGALGFEMASRGARRVLLVDSHPRAVEAMQKLRERLGASSVTVAQADWNSAANREPAASFDVIFLDPPFDAGVLPRALDAAARLLKPAGLLYVESATPLDDSEDGLAARRGLTLERSGRAGMVYFHLLRAPS